MLRDAFDQRREEYDFLGEFVDWKRAWAKESTPHRWLYVTAPTCKGRLFHFLKFRLNPLAKRLLRKV